MHLAVIVVNYNTRDLLRRCLHSVYAAAAGGSLRLHAIVVDNASHDGSAAMVTAEFPQADLIALDNNVGFTRANNLALQRLGFAIAGDVRSAAPEGTTPAPPDYVLLLNADAELAGDALAQMVACLEQNPRAGACGAHLVYGDGGFQHGAFRFPTLAQIALDLFPLAGVPGAHRLHDSRLNGRYPQALWQGGQPFRVDFVLGAALLARGAAIRQVGGLDDGFFMYCEEMDWCLRMAEAAWEVLAAPVARVIHHAGQSSRQVRWPAYEQLWRSRLRFHAKHSHRYPPGYLSLVRLLLRIGLAVRGRQALRRFGRGQVDGVQLGAELAAYTAISHL